MMSADEKQNADLAAFGCVWLRLKIDEMTDTDTFLEAWRDQVGCGTREH